MPRHTNDEPLLVSTVTIRRTPYDVELGEKSVTLIQYTQDGGDGSVSIELEPKTKEEAAQMAMALRLAMRRMNLIADQWT
jgi:hypothetical protein